MKRLRPGCVGGLIVRILLRVEVDAEEAIGGAVTRSPQYTSITIRIGSSNRATHAFPMWDVLSSSIRLGIMCG